MAAHLRALFLLAAAFTADAVVVDTTAALCAAVDRQEATIRLGADLSLGGEPLIFTADCDVRGNGYALLQGPGARHMHVNGTVALEISNVTLALVDAVGLRPPEGTNGSNYTWPTAGGIEIREGNLTARDVSFEGLSAREKGGAVYARDGHTILKRCRFEDTGAGLAGGAVCQESGALLVEDCDFLRTVAALNGGAIAADRATLTIRGSTFVEAAVTGGSFSLGLFQPARGDRFAPSGGGAVWFECTETSFDVADSRFIRCSVGPRAQGGAVRAQSRSQRFTNTLFEANTASPKRIAESRGAALWLAGTRPGGGGVVDPTIIDDDALNDDEELNAFFGGTLIISGCRFYDNSGGNEILAVETFEVFKFMDTTVVGNDGAFFLYLAQVVESHFSHAAFEYNRGLVVRAYQLFAPAFSQKVGSCVVEYSNFSHNYAPRSDDGAAFFVKESPERPIQIKFTRFVNNSAPISKGGALNLQAYAIVYASLFADNSASEGGAVYIGTDGQFLSTWNDFRGNEAVLAGGAISACATEEDATCAGTVHIFGTIASGNRVHEPDGERSGGGFLKSNGADVQLREVNFSDSTAAGRPSSIGLRFGNHQMHAVTLRDNGTIVLANDGVLNIYCSPGTEESIKKLDVGFTGWTVNNHPNECSLCDAGEEWVGSEVRCVPCEPGTFKPADQPVGTMCEECSGRRKFQPHSGRQSCNRCPKTKRANRRHTDCVKTGKQLVLVEIIVGVIGGLMGIAIIFLLVKKGRKEYLEKRKLEAERAVVVRQQVAEALSRVREFRSQLCVLAGDVFVELGELVSHEELLDRGHVIIVPTVARLNRAKASGDVFVFISHQWLDYKTPDPENIHYESMVKVVRAVAEDAMTSLDRIRVWVDYVSIPQENRFTQRAAISSLPTFASSCDYFVVVAPETTHHGACTPCSSRTYRRRAWCRAEIMSCWARNGSSDMYFWSGSRGLKPLTGESGDEILLEAIDVFNGDLTCCNLKHPHGDPCDREELMLPMLGLFAELYRGRDSTTMEAYALIEPLVDRLYPRTFTYHRGDGHPDEEHPLFGDLIDAVRHAVDTEADARSSGDGSPLGSFDGRNYFPGTHARRHSTRTRHDAGSLSSIQSRTSMRLPSLISRRGSSKRRLRPDSPATIKARAADERGRLSPHSTSGTNNSGSRASRKLVNFRTLTWQSSQGESKEDSTGPPTF